MQFLPEKLKDILVTEGLIKPEQFDELQKESDRLNQKLEDVLISRGILSSDYYYQILAGYLGVKLADLSPASIDETALMQLSPDLARQKRSILFKKEEDGTFDIAMEDPSDLRTVEFLERHLKGRVRPFLAKAGDLENGFAIYSKKVAQNFKKVIEENVVNSLQIKEEKAEEKAMTVPVVALVDNFISYAMSLGASDIHIEVLEDAVLVRFRIDGILQEILRIPKEVLSSVLARIKLLASLKIDEHYKPQDGRFHFKIGEESIDIRVAIMPTLYGEKIEMRLLPAAQKPLSLEELGVLDDMVRKIKDSLKKTYGMILVCGPTGSGKTTTLYSILNILNKPEVNIVTVEDPIEYHIKYINQTQINPQAGITFASALRAFLRQDPNIILVGEIRDEETAEISVNAALTGHLVLSSLHTNDAPTAIPRFVDMKVPSFLAAAVLNIIIAQRLVRKICINCIESYTPTSEMLESIKREKDEFGTDKNLEIPKFLFRGKGCATCHFSGYKGRMGIYEVLEMDNEMRNFINSAEFSLDKFSALAKKKGMITMLEDGFKKAALGMTTVEEVLRVIRE